MSSIFNARFDLNSHSQAPGETDIWIVQGNVVDNTGNFSSGNALVGDVIYNDGSAMALGPLRYVVVSIQSVDGATITAALKWGLEGEDPQEPIDGAAGCIGRPDSNGVITIPEALQQGLDVAFCNSVRNMESVLLSKKLSGVATPIGVMYQAQYDKDKDLRIDLEALPVLDMGTF
jgi:hypothetical protein